MTTHKLKIDQEYYRALIEGRKTCEIRYNDRDYQVGDNLHFCEIYQGEAISSNFEITHVLHFPDGLQDGYVALSIRKI